MKTDVDQSYFDQHGFDPNDFLARDPKGNKKSVIPSAPAVVLTNPKFPHNIGQTIRALSCFSIPQLWWTGDRALKSLEGLSRIPREERMRGYEDVAVYHHDRPLDLFEKIERTSGCVTPVAVEFRDNSESLPDFVHPENPVYVFGPEDGSIDPGTLRRCHRFVKIPTRHCTNLSAAVYLVLYDRLVKEFRR